MLVPMKRRKVKMGKRNSFGGLFLFCHSLNFVFSLCLHNVDLFSPLFNIKFQRDQNKADKSPTQIHIRMAKEIRLNVPNGK